MPSILFINRVYPPADGATGQVLEHIALGFVQAGWDVRVLTTTVEGGATGTEIRDGVMITRSGAFFSKRSMLSRAIGYALMIPTLGLRALQLPRADIVVIKTDPPMLLVLGPLLRLLKGSRLIHWAQDLYPEVAEVDGVLREGGICSRILRFISTSSMRCCDVIVTVGRCMAAKIKARGISEEKIRLIPNTGIEQKISPLAHAGNEFRSRHHLDGHFVVEYSGNMGRAHDFATLLDAAQQLQEIGETKILFLLIGGGPARAMLENEAARRGLSNVRLLPFQPGELLAESLGAGDLHLVTMKRAMSGLVVPSKFYGIMAAGRPCLFVGPDDSEVARLIVEYDTGSVFLPGESQGVVDAILSYRDSPEKCKEQGKNARGLVSGQDALTVFVATALEVLSFQKKTGSS